jgi:DNA modification methylase
MSISNANWKVRHELIWVKNNHVMGRCDYQYKHEPILYGWKTKGTHEFFGGFQTSVIEFDKPHSSKLHPTMKPVELIELLVNNSSKSGFIILDTFLGSGSTLIACEKTGRKCYGCEIDEHYCSVVIERWEKFSGKKAERLNASR